MRGFANGLVLSALTLTVALVGGFVAHGLWLIFLYGWDAVE